MSKITDDAGKVIVAGDKVRWKDNTGERNGVVVANDQGELRIGSRSLKEIWDNSDSMEVVV